LVGLREVGWWAGVRRTCAPEPAAVAASSSSGSDDRAVRQLRHPAASVITLLPPVSPEFGLLSAATARWWDLAAFTPLPLMICRCNSSRLSVGVYCMNFLSEANSLTNLLQFIGLCTK
jgi:hypothetical protein